MKPFNLEEAKAGKPVQTTDGKLVRIVDFNRRNTNFPIVAIVDDKDVVTYTIHGTDGVNIANTLVMVTETIVGYINCYDTYIGVLHSSRSVADANADSNRTARIKVTYTEGQYDD